MYGFVCVCFTNSAPLGQTIAAVLVSETDEYREGDLTHAMDIFSAV
jgi:hypothetical protein